MIIFLILYLYAMGRKLLGMENKDNYQPSATELEILQILWEHEPTTVRFIYEQISQKREVGYTSILKQMQRMADKEVVQRELKGKTHYYRAIPKQAEVQQNLFQRFVNNVYQGSAMKLVMHALGQGKTSDEEVEALQKWIEAQKGQKDD